jgi:hypothetical protein
MPEPHGKLFHLDPHPLGGEEVAELMKKNDETKTEDEQQYAGQLRGHPLYFLRL